MNPLEALEIVKSESLAGSKRAVKSGNVVYVSPAMYDLLSNEQGEDLERVLRNLPFIDIGKFNVYEAMESLMITEMK